MRSVLMRCVGVRFADLGWKETPHLRQDAIVPAERGASVSCPASPFFSSWRRSNGANAQSKLQLALVQCVVACGRAHEAPMAGAAVNFAETLPLQSGHIGVLANLVSKFSQHNPTRVWRHTEGLGEEPRQGLVGGYRCDRLMMNFADEVVSFFSGFALNHTGKKFYHATTRRV